MMFVKEDWNAVQKEYKKLRSSPEYSDTKHVPAQKRQKTESDQQSHEEQVDPDIEVDDSVLVFPEINRKNYMKPQDDDQAIILQTMESNINRLEAAMTSQEAVLTNKLDVSIQENNTFLLESIKSLMASQTKLDAISDQNQ